MELLSRYTASGEDIRTEHLSGSGEYFEPFSGHSLGCVSTLAPPRTR